MVTARGWILRVATLAFALLRYGLSSAADERIRGTVLDIMVTHCESAKRGGCSGTLTLQGDWNGKAETLAVKVPSGIPISRGCESVLFPGLVGKTVLVTGVAESRARVARAIEVVESEDNYRKVFCE